MKRPMLLTLVALAIAAFGIALACGSSPIRIATIVSEAGPADAGPVRCEVSDGGDAGETCQDGSFCSKTSCGSKDGVCEVIDSDGCATSEPECGCDGISYFNECLRQAAHVGRAAVGSCDRQDVTNANRCPCDAGQYCATVYSQPFDSPRMPSFGPPDAETTREFTARCRGLQQAIAGGYRGFCWVLPDPCPTPGIRTVFDCEPTCIDECSAIREGGVYALCRVPPDVSAN